MNAGVDLTQEAKAEARAWIAQDRSRRERKIFIITSEQLITDPDVRGPKTRREVFAIPQRSQYLPPRSADVVLDGELRDFVNRTPSLAKMCDAQAVQYIGELEKGLILRDDLGPSQRARIRDQLRRLVRPNTLLWKEWLDQTGSARKLSTVIQRWLDSDVDMSEQHLFKPGWDDIPFSHDAGHAYFARLPDFVRQYLGVEFVPKENTRHGRPVAQLRPSPKEANALSRGIGSGNRFE